MWEEKKRERERRKECRKHYRGDKIMGSACFYCTRPATMDHANPLLLKYKQIRKRKN